MEPGCKRIIIARIAAGFGCLCGVIGLLTGVRNSQWLLSPHGWGTGGILLLLIALFVLLDGTASFGKSRVMLTSNQ
jgi:hypothetical protein